MRDDSNFYFFVEYTNENTNDPTKPPPRVVEETEEEWEDLPDENDEIEDIFVYQNKQDRFLSHYL